jgi:hypothetical protein
MTNKDNETFEKWLEIEFGEEVDKSRAWIYEKSIFRFACEYKQKEQYIEGSIHESGGIKREMTWKESSDMFERMYMNSLTQLKKEYERIREFQTENKKLRQALYDVKGLLVRTFENPNVVGLDVINEALKEVEK